ncbi:hypothetical protein COO59_07345 [Mixta theicola]|uniref:General secretion pathway protein GspM n=1 Tax=Mixta theicola TaxID=1458355 RepID=A0A2K1QBA6_9GAMM|nr:type II secretion system protein GspM [Mixta theicola]PNS12309.1 hypothetical protein COO59_07345 [Mixta theicola]GLR08066.1 hypothetical protein GCM10007905_07850 [Mixta theicola]
MMKQRLFQRWSDYSIREKVLLAVLAVAGVLILCWFGLLSPLMDYQQKGKEKMNKAVQDYLWMADNAAQFDFISPGKGTEDRNLVQRVTQALKEYKPELTIGPVNEQQLELIGGSEPVEFLPLMRFLIYLQADQAIKVDEVDLAAVKGDSNLVHINKLILSCEAKSMLCRQAK